MKITDFFDKNTGTYFCWSIGTSDAASNGGGYSSKPADSTAASWGLTSSHGGISTCASTAFGLGADFFGSKRDKT